MGVRWGREIHTQLARWQWSEQSDPGCILKVERTGFPLDWMCAGRILQVWPEQAGGGSCLRRRADRGVSCRIQRALRGGRCKNLDSGVETSWGWELGSWDPTALGSGAWTRPRGVSGAEAEGKDGAQGAPGRGGREKRRKPGGAASTGAGSQASNWGWELRARGSLD